MILLTVTSYDNGGDNGDDDDDYNNEIRSQKKQ